MSWRIRRFRATPDERRRSVDELAKGGSILAATFDGPFRRNLTIINKYRVAERILTQREIRERMGKPGQSNAPNGRLLNENTNYCVRAVLRSANCAPATHRVAVDGRAVAEAFPSAFLGLMLLRPEREKVSRRSRTDHYFAKLSTNGSLSALVRSFLPGRTFTQPFQGVTNHDDRSALVCALTALCVAGRRYTAVGDSDGWIVLPPQDFIAPWAKKLLAPGDCIACEG
jgi:hypothetical protein